MGKIVVWSHLRERPHTRLCSRRSHCLPVALSCSPHLECCCALSGVAVCARSHGATWRIGSEKIQPRHSTECSVSQSFDGSGDVFIYTRIWSKSCPGCEGYGRGIARSTDVSLATPRAHRRTGSLERFGSGAPGRSELGQCDPARAAGRGSRLRRQHGLVTHHQARSEPASIPGPPSFRRFCDASSLTCPVRDAGQTRGASCSTRHAST